MRPYVAEKQDELEYQKTKYQTKDGKATQKKSTSTMA